MRTHELARERDVAFLYLFDERAGLACASLRGDVQFHRRCLHKRRPIDGLLARELNYAPEEPTVHPPLAWVR